MKEILRVNKVKRDKNKEYWFKDDFKFFSYGYINKRNRKFVGRKKFKEESWFYFFEFGKIEIKVCYLIYDEF